MTEFNNYLDIKDKQRLYNIQMSDLVDGMRTNKPRVKFYTDGSLYFANGWASPTSNEVFGKYWHLGYLGVAELAFWRRIK